MGKIEEDIKTLEYILFHIVYVSKRRRIRLNEKNKIEE